METYYRSLFLLWMFISSSIFAQENAAPSVHLTYYYPSKDAILKMISMKIVNSANNSYFEIHSFTNGYSGLQQTSTNSSGASNTLISSLWDVNTANGILSTVEYTDPNTQKSRFGGEGDGWKTVNPYKWKLNSWYNMVQRSWKSNGKLYVGTFIHDISANVWFHTATLSIPFPNKYLGSTDDSFLENWYGYNALWNGSVMRKAFYKDCWNMNTSGNWEKNTSAFFSANNSQADIKRNGIYHNSFNAFIDNIENAYCMQHGSTTTPSADFKGGRTLSLPALSNQGQVPVLTTIATTKVSINYKQGKINVNWDIDISKSPQLSARVEILNSNGSQVVFAHDTVPERRNFTITKNLSDGNYTMHLTVWDIFNQKQQPVIVPFTISGGIITTIELYNELVSEFKITPNPASSNCTVSFTATKPLSDVTFLITNSLGQLIYKFNNSFENAPIVIQLPLDQLPPGLYNVTVYNSHNHLLRTEKLLRIE